MNELKITDTEIEKLHRKLKKDAKTSGYFLNTDIEFVKELIRGLLVNEKRYGYLSCPCRIASGNINLDLDIICPCDYRDSDLNDFGSCYCALYVSQDIFAGNKKARSIPERRPPPDKRKNVKIEIPEKEISNLSLPIWRCKVCGYLCARENPPETCPICNAKKERFERFR